MMLVLLQGTFTPLVHAHAGRTPPLQPTTSQTVVLLAKLGISGASCNPCCRLWRLSFIYLLLVKGVNEKIASIVIFHLPQSLILA